MAPDQLVVCSQNHDQIGNRARGERLSMLVDLPKLKAIAALTLLSPFVPLLFQGEEWGASTPFLYFTDHQDCRARTPGERGTGARVRRAFAGAARFRIHKTLRLSSARSSTGPSCASPGTRSFSTGTALDRTAKEPHASPRPRRPKVRFDAQAEWLRFEYAGVLAVFNFAGVPRRIALPVDEWDVVLDSEAGGSRRGGPPEAEFPPHVTRIYRRRRAVA